MPVVYHALALLTLCGWVGLWWLAVRIICGRHFGPAECMPVAFLAFGVPIMLIDAAAGSGLSFGSVHPLAVWTGIGVVIDAAGLGLWWYRRRNRRAAEPGIVSGGNTGSKEC